MSGYPDGELGARLEFNLGGWTDVMDAAMKDGDWTASIRSGQAATAQQPSPALLTTALDNDTGTFSPRNATSPYYRLWRQNTPARVSVDSPYGAYLRLEAGDSARAFVQDTSSLHVTGSLEVRLELRLSNWQGCVLAARCDNTGPSWYWLLNGDGTQTFAWYDSVGSLHSFTGGAVPYASGFFALSARLDLDALTCGFYLSGGIDGTFALLEESAVAAGDVRAGNAPLVVGWSASGLAGQLSGMVTQCRLYDGVGGTLVADADFASQSSGASSWTDGTGLTWQLAGGAEVTDRDYVLHAEASSIVPQALTAGGKKAVVQFGGRLRRLQQGSQPAAYSPLKRAILAQTGDLTPVVYWTLEDGKSNTNAFGPALGTTLMAFGGSPQPASDTSFEASGPLPVLNGAVLNAAGIPAYSGASAWVLRFPLKIGRDLPEAGLSQTVCQVLVSGGTVAEVQVNVDTNAFLQLLGLDASGGQVFDSGWINSYDVQNPKWMSVEATPVAGGKVQYNLLSLAPGATSAAELDAFPQVTETLGTVSELHFNVGANVLTDTVIGHVTLQKAWNTMFALGNPLNAWRTERAADRFTRICGENGIPCRVLGSPGLTQRMGPQPRGSVWQILRDVAWTEQGVLFEPADSFSVGLRTRSSMTGQLPAVTLSFSEANLPGSMQAADDDAGLLNDITASMPDGTQVRVVLDDGSPRSVSEPPVGAGRYTGQPPLPFNTSDAAGLADVAQFYLSQVAVDEAKYRQLAANFGVPGAPARDMALTRPGDLVVLEVPAPPNVLTDGSGDMILDGSGDPVTDGSMAAGEAAQAYQTGDIRQLWTGQTLALGPGRAVTWDCVPASPWHPADLSSAVDGQVLDTVGGGLLDTDGNPILDTGE